MRILIASAGLTLILTACGASASSPSATTTGSVAASQSGAAAAPAAADAPAADPAAQRGRPPLGMPGVMGEISAVEGNTLTVSGQDQQTATVELTDSTMITKQLTITLSDILVGDTLMAVGTQDGDVLTATEIRVGDMGAGPGGDGPAAGAPPAGGQPGGPGGQPGAGPDGAPQPGDRLVGTVETIASDTITVTTQDGTSVQVKLASDGQVRTQAEATTADLTVGTWVIVGGDQSDTAIVAVQIQIVPAMAAQR
ncbi:MAG: hypothetical protein HGA45_07225 [Chloroflexales bacterium]|nr:hypothetical protein [Chloroflexales bacterium]